VTVSGPIFGNTTTYPNQNNDPYTYPPDWNSLLDVTNTSGRPEAIDELWHATTVPPSGEGRKSPFRVGPA